jgi:cell wall-associated NlpC family hydrolase
MKVLIESYIGTPYQYGGVSYQGIDCSGLVTEVYRRGLNISLPRNTEALFCEGVGEVVPRRNLRFGDLVFFRDMEEHERDNDGCGVSHVGIYMGDEVFVHSSISRGVTEDDINSSYYARRYAGARRVYLR